MRVNGIKPIRRNKRPRSIAGRPSIIAPNRLQRAFTVDVPNKVWVTDITYVRTWQVYLAVIVDLFARKVVGWSMKPSLSRELAMDALLMAVWRRKPAGRRRAFGSRQPIWQRRLQAVLSEQQSRTQHEPTCQLLGQCRRRVILLQLEEEAHSKAHLQNPRPRPRRHLRLYRGLLQPSVLRRSEPPRREAGKCLPNRGQST